MRSPATQPSNVEVAALAPSQGAIAVKGRRAGETDIAGGKAGAAVVGIGDAASSVSQQILPIHGRCSFNFAAAIHLNRTPPGIPRIPAPLTTDGWQSYGRRRMGAHASRLGPQAPALQLFQIFL